MFTELVPSKVHERGSVPGICSFWWPLMLLDFLRAWSLYLHTIFFLCVQISHFYKDVDHIRIGPTLMASFQLHYPYKDPISKEGHILRCQGVRRPTYIFGGEDTTQPQLYLSENSLTTLATLLSSFSIIKNNFSSFQISDSFFYYVQWATVQYTISFRCSVSWFISCV